MFSDLVCPALGPFLQQHIPPTPATKLPRGVFFCYFEIKHVSGLERSSMQSCIHEDKAMDPGLLKLPITLTHGYAQGEHLS